MPNAIGGGDEYRRPRSGNKSADRGGGGIEEEELRAWSGGSFRSGDCSLRVVEIVAVAMPAEQENAAAGVDRPKRTWNSSTKLTQPRRVARPEARPRGRPGNGSSGHDRTGRATSAKPTRIPQSNYSIGFDSNRNRDHGGEERADESEQRILTRELLERAVSTAFGGLLQESTLDATAFPDHESQSSELSSVRDKENVR